MVLSSTIECRVSCNENSESYVSTHAVGAIEAHSAIAVIEYLACFRLEPTQWRQQNHPHLQSTTKNIPEHVVTYIQTLPAVPPFASESTLLLKERQQVFVGMVRGQQYTSTYSQEQPRITVNPHMLKNWNSRFSSCFLPMRSIPCSSWASPEPLLLGDSRASISIGC